MYYKLCSEIVGFKEFFGSVPFYRCVLSNYNNTGLNKHEHLDLWYGAMYKPHEQLWGGVVAQMTTILNITTI